MKKVSLLLVALMLSFTLLFLFSCEDKASSSPSSVESVADGEEIPAEGLWKNATYRKNTTLGQGSKTFTLTVSIEGKSINLTIKTDAQTVGDALQALGVVAGEESAYGLYIKKVNGVLADYDTDCSYWAFYIGNEYASSGVDTTDIVSGTTYKLERTVMS